MQFSSRNIEVFDVQFSFLKKCIDIAIFYIKCVMYKNNFLMKLEK